jgi:hypothetical protein
MTSKKTPETSQLDDAESGFEIGYGKPPKKNRFQPGQSGNPKGRPKGTKNLKTDLEAELKERVPVREGNKVRKIPKQRALLKATFAKGLNGDMRATNTIFALMERLLAEDSSDATSLPLSTDERNILDQYVNQKINKLNNGDPDGE